MVLGNWIPTCRRVKLDPRLMSCTKLTQNYLNVRNDTLKLLGGNRGTKKFLDIDLNDTFLDMTPKPQSIKEKKLLCNCCLLFSQSHVWLFCDPRTVAHQALCPWAFPGKNIGVGGHSFLQGSSQPRDWTHVSSRHILYHWATREAQVKSPPQQKKQSTKWKSPQEMWDNICK